MSVLAWDSSLIEEEVLQKAKDNIQNNQGTGLEITSKIIHSIIFKYIAH